MILSDKNYKLFENIISDAIDMAYLKGVQQTYGEDIRNNLAFKKYRSNLISWSLERHEVVSKTDAFTKKKLNETLEEVFKL